MTMTATSLDELDAMDSDLMVEGYRAGLGYIQVNYTRKDKAYWHGYLNGQVDKGEIPISPEQRALARAIVQRGDLSVIFGTKH